MHRPAAEFSPPHWIIDAPEATFIQALHGPVIKQTGVGGCASRGLRPGPGRACVTALTARWWPSLRCRRPRTILSSSHGREVLDPRANSPAGGVVPCPALQ